jgi:ATP-binding cassette, subfamily G (WHITE), member 2, PDR
MESSSDRQGSVSDDRRESTVQELAKRLTNHSERLRLQSPFHAEPGSSLDPSSPCFRARDWAKAFYRVVTESSPRKVAGIAFQNLDVYGHGSPTDYQMSVGNGLLKIPSMLARMAGAKQKRIDILHGVEGLVRPGEMLCVLGPPGSGCSSLLKTIAGDTYGLKVAESSAINYQGIPMDKMHSIFRGEAIYTAEVDAHFPELTVADTLYFAAKARTPCVLPNGVSPKAYAVHLRDVIMAMFGISHTKDTKVGNDFVRGVSGGERKRVTIAEATLSNSPLQCWDNSTRGLDSANAIEFCKTLRIQSDVFGCTSCVAIYQSPQAAYDLFDKVTVLYDGRQIFFGPASDGRSYFERMGFACPDSQTTPDFLTSMTNPAERIVKAGFENRTPRTADDFASAWRQSPERQQLMNDIAQYDTEHPLMGESYEKFAGLRKDEKSKYQRTKSPYTLSYVSQVELCMWRGFTQLKNDPSVTIVMLIGNFFEALMIASIFVNLPETTSSFFSRGALLFMLVLLNAFGSLLEIISLYAKRTIVEKHNRYALYRPSAEAISSMILDLPYKLLNTIFVNTTLYFMGNLRRTASAYFFFLLISFTIMMSMSMFFRLFASLTKTIAQALAPSSIILLAMALYTGFALPIDYMRGWASWMRWLNPVSYGFESIMLNEFWGRDFACSQFVPSGPGYEDVGLDQQACAVTGSVLGQTTVSGTAFVRSAYSYDNSNRWRNYGILIALTVSLTIIHLIVSELVAAERSKGEVLVFRRGQLRKARTRREQDDEEDSSRPSNSHSEKSETETEAQAKLIEKQTSVFHWRDVSYEIKVKKETRQILDRVNGWVKPGTLTALMGVSGAGKTTLLDVLASRTTIGVITGEMLIDGRLRDSSFQRKTGYVQQQDLHLHSSTVREALVFSALLRQPQHYSRQEKLDYVDTVISLLNMEEYADAVVGVPGSGLNVEQRKRLTIGVELVARPSLLL